MAQLAQAQFTLTDDTDIVISIEPPENATKDMLWLDVSSNPIILKRWSGVVGTIDNSAINSKTNYQWTENTTVIVSNPQQDFGIYSLVCATPTIVGNNWSIKINQGIQYDSNTIEPLNFFEQYASFVTTNITSITFPNTTSGTFWCPAIDKTINETLTLVQNNIADIQTLLNQLQFVKLTHYNNNT